MLEKHLEKILTAADNHGEDSGEPDQTVGDLQDILRDAWEIMTVSQKIQLLKSDAVGNVIELGGRDEIDVDVEVQAIKTTIAEMAVVLADAGYKIKEGDGSFFWETEKELSEDFYDYDDAVLSAHAAHLEDK